MTVFRPFSNNEVLSDLQANVTDGRILTDSDTLNQFSFSKNLTDDDSGLAMAVIEAHSVKDIQGTLKTARKFHIPVVPQDQATSTVIGSDGIENSFILSTAKMNQIKEISRADSLAVVEPGVINGDLDKEVRKQGMFYAPDPGSKPISGIGGNVNTNAGGMSTVKYGATKDNVLGVKVVLADGREIKLGGRTLKQAFGYDLTQLIVGSEGTLGIVTEVTVKLLPIPLGTPVMGLAFFDNMTELSKAVAAIRISGVYPTMLEALDSNTVIALDKYEGTHYASDNGAMLIFKLDNGTQEAMDVINKLLNDHNADHIQVTQDATEQAALEKLRQDMLPAIFTGNQHIMEDMAVPLSQLAPLMDYIQDLSKELGVKIYTAGHAGDGNVHPSIVWPESVKETPDTVIIALQKMFKKTLELGGTISGEHAVGMLKNQWNNAELGEDVDQLQHQIKDLFDPMNVLNPKRKID
ncbi:FAD-binding oxidoreductase [Companilactobacillus sp.]|jgi:glycolate oxidase|uniref:FAD-binding oxidoreductase n=1 Tax=Companilactobacillus sp. TaxID=2767905 RepID=UPI0025C6C19B|nr:FAD-linked oxidase C-terminal domain-containing protein [Companilactobacillus sp.]MCH4009154.1 FAD-binding protein [Companilactobacillus sp.]MCH4050667.1 FAD-binding protein [Companilactobacillus sp.]MCH4077096.1 FAD-binding protein [Companilactobacillus sp.]MCH4125672.1 FAD-binding protein [Companilactobacillus sp.]MCI1311381.1 FAD-binding protein [Companilactobacillus sp.]